MKKSGNGFYIEVSDDELKNIFPELINFKYKNNMTFFLNDDEESIEYFVAIDGFLNNVKLHKTSFEDSYNKTEESTSQSLIASETETSYSSLLNETHSSETTSSIDSPKVSDLSEKIDSFIANYTSIPPD
ncbi:hypothetical protein ABQE21_03400 [Enterococcus casseliflavus]|uniref:hypothetical protein n=1 Tax=Enterococcus TaxID=1350 RepID=UPI000763D9E3|nr:MULTISPECIES: hypothetical protein [Enterococcus]MBO0426109.1 hypothetical protein [Enterococcus faecium]MBR8699222.1 hypothetical protein [Enterococcus casseliflavus]OJG30790.1 hypothetical protein RU99_GL003291 [Enterococcus casseliflavus]QQU17598.1 hypothetical protein I6I79_06710 [Enterococcus casseliflavus]QQU23470.1 hypothetical protein I6I77_02320 [Enterococcus casseliflavus]